MPAKASTAGILVFTLGEGGWHHYHLRPFVGKTGMIVTEAMDGAVLQVLFPDGAQRISVASTLGTVSRQKRIDLGQGRVVTAADAYDGPPRRFEVELPLPPRDLSPNARCHRMVKAKATAAFRADVARLLTEACIPPLRVPVRVSLDFFLHRRREPVAAWGSVYDPTTWYYPTDQDNARASCKALQDALMDAYVIAEDNAEHVMLGETVLRQKAADHQGKTCLILTLGEEAPPRD